MAIKILLKDVRIFFPSLFKEGTYQGQPTGRYSSKFRVEKNSENMKILTEAVLAEAKATWPEDWQRMLMLFKGDATKSCMIDGDLSETEGFDGGIILTGQRKLDKGRPVVVDRNKNPLIESDGKPYSGSYVNASLEIWGQNKNYKGMRCGLLAVQFVRDGEAFTGGHAATDEDFDDLSPAGENVTALHKGPDAVALF